MSAHSEKAVLVTGSARRVGAATVRALHTAGCRVVVHCNHSRTEADALAAELNAIRAKSAAVVQGDHYHDFILGLCRKLVDAGYLHEDEAKALRPLHRYLG